MQVEISPELKNLVADPGGTRKSSALLENTVPIARSKEAAAIFSRDGIIDTARLFSFRDRRDRIIRPRGIRRRGGSRSRRLTCNCAIPGLNHQRRDASLLTK